MFFTTHQRGNSWKVCMNADMDGKGVSDGGLVTKSCPTLCNPMDCNPPSSSVYEILRTRMLEWVDISFSRGSSRPRDGTHVSCITGRFSTTKPPGKPRVLGDPCKSTRLVWTQSLNHTQHHLIETHATPAILHHPLSPKSAPWNWYCCYPQH